MQAVNLCDWTAICYSCHQTSVQQSHSPTDLYQPFLFKGPETLFGYIILNGAAATRQKNHQPCHAPSVCKMFCGDVEYCSKNCLTSCHSYMVQIYQQMPKLC